jgi:excisionase family DNA binding protein
VADALQVSTKTARRLVASGDLPAVRVGRLVRVQPDDLRRFIADRTMRSVAVAKPAKRGSTVAAGVRLWD